MAVDENAAVHVAQNSCRERGVGNVVEIVTFRLTDHSAYADFVEDNACVNTWLGRQPGFVSRELSLREDGSWVDVIQWHSLEDARQAVSKILDELGDCASMVMIDPDSIAVFHAQVQLSA